MESKTIKLIVLVVVVAVLAGIVGLVASSLKKLDSFEGALISRTHFYRCSRCILSISWKGFIDRCAGTWYLNLSTCNGHNGPTVRAFFNRLAVRIGASLLVSLHKMKKKLA